MPLKQHFIIILCAHFQSHSSIYAHYYYFECTVIELNHRFPLPFSESQKEANLFCGHSVNIIFIFYSLLCHFHLYNPPKTRCSRHYKLHFHFNNRIITIKKFMKESVLRINTHRFAFHVLLYVMQCFYDQI